MYEQNTSMMNIPEQNAFLLPASEAPVLFMMRSVCR